MIVWKNLIDIFIQINIYIYKRLNSEYIHINNIQFGCIFILMFAECLERLDQRDI